MVIKLGEGKIFTWSTRPLTLVEAYQAKMQTRNLDAAANYLSILDCSRKTLNVPRRSEHD